MVTGIGYQLIMIIPHATRNGEIIFKAISRCNKLYTPLVNTYLASAIHSSRCAAVQTHSLVIVRQSVSLGSVLGKYLWFGVKLSCRKDRLILLVYCSISKTSCNFFANLQLVIPKSRVFIYLIGTQKYESSLGVVI